MDEFKQVIMSANKLLHRYIPENVVDEERLAGMGDLVLNSELETEASDVDGDGDLLDDSDYKLSDDNKQKILWIVDANAGLDQEYTLKALDKIMTSRGLVTLHQEECDAIETIIRAILKLPQHKIEEIF